MSESLRAGRSGDRIPVGARFSAPVQTGPGVHPASYTRGALSFPRVKRPGRGVETHPSSAKFKEKVELYLYSTSGPSWPVLGWNLPLPLTHYVFPTRKAVTCGQLTGKLHYEYLWRTSNIHVYWSQVTVYFILFLFQWIFFLCEFLLQFMTLFEAVKQAYNAARFKIIE